MVGKRGPAPKPTHMRVIEGNPGKRALPAGEPAPRRGARTPSMPGWLPENAQAIWRQHARALWELGLLTEIDVDALATLSETTALYRTAVRMIGTGGAVWTSEETGYTQASAWVAIRNNTLKQMRALWQEFGMTPSSRTRVQVGKTEEEKNPLQALMERARKNASAS